MDIRQVYKEIRQKDTFIPASSAYRCAKRKVDLENWVKKVGFKWQEDRNYNLNASWQQEGFKLSARVVSDDDSWWFFGVEHYGKFSPRWEPGAIRHWKRRDSRSCEWFVPSENLPMDRHTAYEAYKRAASYGEDWWYVGIIVTARRAGIKLGETGVYGIESDSGEDYFTETVFELADEVIAEATEALCHLCKTV